MPRLTKPLTKRLVDATAPDPARDVFLWDGGDGAVKGFGLRVRPSGRRTFVFQYDALGGATRRVTLGDFGALTVEQARDAARQCAAEAATAKRDPTQLDPAAAKRQAKVAARAAALAPTVADLAKRYLEDRRRRGKRERTLDHFGRAIARHIAPAFGARKIADVTRRDVERLVRGLEKTPGTGNRVLTILGAMFAYAEREELRAAHTNPAAGIERYPEPRRARSLTEAEYGALGAALTRAVASGLPRLERALTPGRQAARARQTARQAAGQPRRGGAPRGPWDPRLVALFRFLALSGWRESEARTLRWGEVDLKRGVAVLLDTKTGRSTRPLGKEAVAVLEALPRALGGAYVFPGAKKGAPRATVRGAWAWSAVRHAAGLAGGDGIAPARLHDLRHSFTTVARGLGYGDHVIAALIGHTVRGGMTSRYGDVPDALVRQAADAVAGAIAKMLDAPAAHRDNAACVLTIDRPA